MTLPLHAIQHEILRALARTATSYLEIGVQEGKSLRVVVENSPQLSQLVLCDDWGKKSGGSGRDWGKKSGGSGRGGHDHIVALLDALKYHGAVTFLDGRSQDLLPGFLAAHSGGFDLVHIDGEHTTEGCLKDLWSTWPVVRKHLVVHDIRMPSVWTAVCQFFSGDWNRATVTVCFGGHGTLVVTV